MKQIFIKLYTQSNKRNGKRTISRIRQASFDEVIANFEDLFLFVTKHQPYNNA